MTKAKRRSVVPRAPSGCAPHAQRDQTPRASCDGPVSTCSADGWGLQPGPVQGCSEVWDCPGAQGHVGCAAGAWQHDEGDQVAGCAFSANAEAPLVQGTVVVLLQNVPSELCNVAMMEVVLQQAQIEASIVNCWAEDSSALGEVSLALESQEVAELCISHFQGCQWG